MRALFIICLLFVAVNAHAQVGTGPEVGAGMSTMHFAPPTMPILYTSASVSGIFSGKVGWLADVPLNKHFYFQGEVSISRKGADRSFSYHRNDSFNEQINQTLSIYYLEVPLTVLYKTGEQGKGRFIAGVGASPAYIVGGRNKLRDNQVYGGIKNDTYDDLKISVGNTVAGFDIGVNVCAGYELPTGLFFKAYYTVGTNDIGMGTEVDKNRMWGVSAGYFLSNSRNVNKAADDLIDHTK